MYGASVGTLNVYSGNTKVFSVSGNQGNDWLIVLKNLYLEGAVTFEGITGSSYTGDVAIDQVRIIEGSCPVSCSFDDGLCFGWSQSNSDVFDWTLNSGSTPSSSTGPSSDPSGTGKYMYIEATGRSPGDNAKLQFAVPGSNSPSCLTFYYHMYGSDMGTLNVFSGNVTIFTKSGDQENYWRKVTRKINLSDVVTFEGIRGSSYRGDLAIDDVSIMNGNCQGHTATPTLSTASTSTTSLPSVSPASMSFTDKPSMSPETSMLSPSTVKPPLSLSSSQLTPFTNNPSMSSGSSAFTPSTDKTSLSTSASTLTPFTDNPSMSSGSSTFTPSTDKTSLSSSASTFNPSFVNPSLSSSSSKLNPSTDKPSLSSIASPLSLKPPIVTPSLPSSPSTSSTKDSSSEKASTQEASISPRQSSFNPSSVKPSLPSSPLPDITISTPTPKTPSPKEKQKSVMLEVRNLDIKKWNKQMESDFKREVARAATDFCAVEGTRCQFTLPSSRRKRSSNNKVFTSDMVHILPGYPKQSPDDPLITLLAFYLQLPQGFSENFVDKDVLKDIVESDVSSIGGSIGGTISSVQPFPLTDTPTTDDENDEESKPTSVIIGASVGGALLLVLIGLFVLSYKKSRRVNEQSAKKKEEDNNYNNGAYFNNAYYIGSGNVAVAGNVADPRPEEHYYAAINDPPISTNQPTATLKFPEASAQRSSEGLASSIYQPINRGVAESIYQQLNSGTKFPEA